MDDDRRLTRMMIMLLDRVHGVVGIGASFVNTPYRAVTDGAAVVPSHFRTHRDRLERSFLRCSHTFSLVLCVKRSLAGMCRAQARGGSIDR